MYPADEFITVNGLRLHYLDWGNPNAPPLLLLHGGAAHAHWWDRFAPHFAGRFHVIATDLRGHGDSDWARPPAYDVEDYVADVVALIHTLDLRELRLIGHSLGGVVATVAAAQVPGHIAALVIVDSRTRGGQSGARFMQRLARMSHPRYRSREQGIAQYRLLPADSSAPAEILAQVAAHALRQDESDGKWTLKFDRLALAAIDARDIAPALRQLHCPILAVRGSASPLMSPGAIAILRAAAPQTELAEITGAHHHVMLDRPEQFADVVSKFLDGA
jgi:pimeloyl-ACP methyl ester carboxylesterase